MHSLPSSPARLFSLHGCPYCEALRDDLRWREVDFVEVDVERDVAAWHQVQRIRAGLTSVPVLVQDGEVVQVGWHGRSCFAGIPPPHP